MKTNLQKLRINAGFNSATKFAEAVGLKKDTYRNYENSSCRIPLDNAVKIADFLNCELDDLVERKYNYKINTQLELKTDDQDYVLKCYRKLSSEDQKAINKYIISLFSLMNN